MDFQSFEPSGLKPVILTAVGVSTPLRAYPIPKSCRFIYALMVGAGGNGGAGFTRAAGGPGGGGGGGGSGATVRSLIPASVFSGTLYYRCEPAGSTLSSGIWLTPEGSPAVASSLCSAGPGSNGGAGAVGAAGALGAAGTVGTALFPALGIATGGLAGVAGGAQTGAVGGTSTTAILPIVMGGAGGGGIATTTNFAGGPVTMTGVLTITLAGGLAAGGNGNNGWTVGPYMTSLGGSGGGTNDTGVGGAGGNGGVGCGGGGGGAGQTGGAGGRGGDSRIWLWFL